MSLNLHLSFFSNLDEAKPTWYTAVPTMHQAILARSGRNSEIIKNNPEKFEILVKWFVNASMYLLNDIEDLAEIDVQLRNAG